MKKTVYDEIANIIEGATEYPPEDIINKRATKGIITTIYQWLWSYCCEHGNESQATRRLMCTTCMDEFRKSGIK
jgi:hypothetical protein